MQTWRPRPYAGAVDAPPRIGETVATVNRILVFQPAAQIVIIV
jgi:hypothetical protein